MLHVVEKHGDKFAIVKKHNGEVVSKHDTHRQAFRALAKINAAKKPPSEEGEAVKDDEGSGG